MNRKQSCYFHSRFRCRNIHKNQINVLIGWKVGTNLFLPCKTKAVQNQSEKEQLLWKNIQQFQGNDEVFKIQNKKAKLAIECNATMRVKNHCEKSIFMIVCSWFNRFLSNKHRPPPWHFSCTGVFLPTPTNRKDIGFLCYRICNSFVTLM